MNLTGTNNGGGLSSSAQATMQGFLNGGIYGAISAGAGSLLNRFPTPHEDLNKNTLFATNIRNSASDVLLSSGNPYAMAAGAAVKLIDKTGGFTDASEGLGGTNDTLNTLASLTLPGAGWFTKPIEKYEVSAATKAMKNSYAGTLKDNQKAAKNSGAKILFGRNLATSKIHVGKANDRMIENIKQDSNDDYQTMATMTQSKAMEDQYAYTGGYQQALARAGKFGMKIERAKMLAKIDFKPEEKVEGFKLGGVLDVKEFIDTTKLLNANFFASLTFDDLPKYQEGGSFEAKPTEDTSESKKNELVEKGLETFKEGGLMNVIPEGNLHARLHHMEDSEKFTQKGIPVIDKDGNLQAEIELNEIIFNLEVTEKLEKMYKSYKDYESNKEKDEVAIQAGKLIAKEIMENTDDRTGLIDTLKKGGVIKALEGTEIPVISLEDFIKEKIKDRTEQAIQKATTRKIGYKFKNPNWLNCIATATDNYGVPVVIRNSDLAADPNKYGFEELQFNSIDDLPMGVLILDYNKPKDASVPGHTIMYVGLSDPDKEGRSYPLYSYSSGKSVPEDMHNYAKYNFMRWDDKVKPRAYRYIGTPTERSQWEEEYYSLYPTKKLKHQSLNQVL